MVVVGNEKVEGMRLLHPSPRGAARRSFAEKVGQSKLHMAAEHRVQPKLSRRARASRAISTVVKAELEPEAEDDTVQAEAEERSAPSAHVVYETIRQEGEDELERGNAALA